MNKSEIFKKAWEAARDAVALHSESRVFKYGSWIVKNEGVTAKASEFFAECLKQVWAAVKRAAAKKHTETVTHCLSWYSMHGNTSAANLAAAEMMMAGDAAPAYDEIEMNA